MTRSQIHLEFMKAAMTGLLTKMPLVDQTGEYGIKVDDKLAWNAEIGKSVAALADAALAAYEKRWNGVFDAEQAGPCGECASTLGLCDCDSPPPQND